MIGLPFAYLQHKNMEMDTCLLIGLILKSVEINEPVINSIFISDVQSDQSCKLLILSISSLSLYIEPSF